MNEPPPVSERDDGYIQDLGSQWVTASVPAREGHIILDVCAAPGGKATGIATCGATVIAADLQPQRVGLVTQNAVRLGTSDVLALAADATRPPFPPATFDTVLIDAPCSGLGTLRRRADARWRMNPSDVTDLVALQQRIINACEPLVKVGGVLVYSVCTLLAAESTEHSFSAEFEAMIERPEGEWRRFGSGWRVLPHDANTDGMILLRYRKQS